MTDLNDCDGILETSPEPEDMLDSAFESETPKEEYNRIMNSLATKICAYNTTLVAELNTEGQLMAHGRIYLTDTDNASIEPGDEVSILISRFYDVKDNGDITIHDYFDIDYWRKHSVILSYRSRRTRESLAKALNKLFQMVNIALGNK